LAFDHGNDLVDGGHESQSRIAADPVISNAIGLVSGGVQFVECIFEISGFQGCHSALETLCQSANSALVGVDVWTRHITALWIRVQCEDIVD